jgi:hypothetical protein
MLAQDRDNHGRIFGALRFVDGNGVGQANLMIITWPTSRRISPPPTSIFDKTYMNQLFQLGYNPALWVSGGPNKVLTLMQPSRNREVTMQKLYNLSLAA